MSQKAFLSCPKCGGPLRWTKTGKLRCDMCKEDVSVKEEQQLEIKAQRLGHDEIECLGHA